MSGGGRPSKGRMGQSVVSTNVATPGQVEKMSRQLEQLESRAKQLRDRHDTLQPMVNQLPQQLKKMQMDLRKFTAEIKSAVENEPILKEQVKKQEERLKAAAPNAAEVKRLEAIIKKTQAAFDNASEAAEKINSEVKKLHKQIVDKTGGRMLAAQKKLDEISKNIDKVRKEKTKLTVAITTSKRDVKKASEKITNMEQEVKDGATALTNMQEEISKITAKGRVLIDKIETFSSEIVEQEQILTLLKQQVKDIGEIEFQKKTVKLDVEHRLEAIVTVVQDYEGRMRAQKKKLDSLKTHRIPGEESAPELKIYAPEEINAETIEQMQYTLTIVEAKLNTKKPNFVAIEEYCEREAIYMRRTKELEELTGQRNEMRTVVEDLRKRRLDEFMLGFNIITDKLKEMYQMITLGGDAELELVDSLDPFREGIIFSVRPPKKSWKNISNLSGGEKTLSSLALVFALHYYKPSPLYVMDEIDAALDFKNVSIVGNYIKERTKNAQFIIISLRANMFELADRLVGIFKTYNATKSCTLNPRQYGKQPRKAKQLGDTHGQKTPDKTLAVVDVETAMEQPEGITDTESAVKTRPALGCVLIENPSQIETLDIGVLVEKSHVNS